MATRVCVERGAESTLVIPADIPLIQSWELEEILKTRTGGRQRTGPGRRRTRHQRRLPPSRRICSRCASATTVSSRIYAAAQATGKPCIVLELPGIAVDVDNPADLQQLLALRGETRSQKLARQYFPLGTIDSAYAVGEHD